jgi:hypothetical protein
MFHISEMTMAGHIRCFHAYLGKLNQEGILATGMYSVYKQQCQPWSDIKELNCSKNAPDAGTIWTNSSQVNRLTHQLLCLVVKTSYGRTNFTYKLKK